MDSSRLPPQDLAAEAVAVRHRATRGTARAALIAAAHSVVRRQGYAATSVDDLCAAAGVTKGAFFHHFPSKEALAVAAAGAWTERAAPLFAVPAIVALDDPLDRLLAHIDLRLSMIDGPAEDFTCFVGTMVQESFASSDAIRAACDASLSAYCHALSGDIAAAIARHGAADGITALSLACHVQAVLQGAFILAKAANDPAIARDTVAHLKRYVLMLFGRGSGETSTASQREERAMTQMIFVNLPITDLDRSKAFYEAVGAANNPQFSDETAACMMFSDVINVMLLTHDKWRDFTSKPIVDAHSAAQVLLCVSADSREAVGAMVDAATRAGGKADPTPTQDFPFMFGRSFEDPDGHIWEVMWMNPDAMPE